MNKFTDEIFEQCQSLWDKYLYFVKNQNASFNQNEVETIATCFQAITGRMMVRGCTGCLIDAFTITMSQFEREQRIRTETQMKIMHEMLCETNDEPNVESIQKIKNAITKTKKRRVQK